MKWKKRIGIWAVVSLSLQFLGLFYINNYFLANDSKVVTKEVVYDKSKIIKNKEIIVPANAKNILVSYDGKYLSYFENEELKIVNCSDGKIQNIKAEDGTKISFPKWLPDRNRILLVEKKSDAKSSDLVLYSYDVLKREKAKIKDLALGDINSEVKDIKLSPLTGVTYLLVISGDKSSSLYRIDRMGEMTKTSTIPSSVGNMASVRHEDKLVYEGLTYNKIYATSGDQPISIKGVEKLTLIGSDFEDNMYLGEVKNNLVTKIYYGKTLENTGKWKVLNLPIPSTKNDLFISPDGKVYQNDEVKSVIKEVNSGTQTSYEGKVLQLYSKGIVTLLNNKISFVPFK
ncbi:hypothetical protein K9O30_12935 [Clostridium bowmanii]|uniref:hypothetical protein n=1 Tax=Clostridium bowmanii TaxID=132925 RepID=UPI001C0BFF72|nr:hypothetical protein [Clostridium bowmanii]MBU3189955.1 hypothetical protein [Clostridium bowmanii]MCA1074611.1 hypothetical protein [Clostridium bowmanii]